MLIFLPTVMLDGVMINVEWFLSNHTDLGDVFDYDSVALLVLDIFLYIKLFINVAQETNTEGCLFYGSDYVCCFGNV